MFLCLAQSVTQYTHSHDIRKCIHLKILIESSQVQGVAQKVHKPYVGQIAVFSLSLSQHTCICMYMLVLVGVIDKGDSMINGLERHQWLVKRVIVACFYRLCGAINNEWGDITHTHTYACNVRLCEWVCVCALLISHATGQHHAILLAALKTYNDL